MDCTVFIDESGDNSIRKIRSKDGGGASPYFVLAAVVMPNASVLHAKKVLAACHKEIGKNWKHATDLNHSQTVYFARRALEINARYFAVISNKDTLGEYAEKIDYSPHKFYNKCAVYLLERVGKYMAAKGLGKTAPRVVFEERNHNYDAMRRYIGKTKDTPLHSHAKWLQVFNPFGIVALKKDEEELLKYADLAAHAVYQCANKTPTNFGIPEPRYLRELSAKFAVDEKGKIIGSGIKCIHSLQSLNLDKDVDTLLNGLRGNPIKK